MKKLILLVLVNCSAYGNVVVKESLLKKILCCLCPCLKKKPEPTLKRCSGCVNLRALKTDYRDYKVGDVIEFKPEEDDYISEEELARDVLETKTGE